MADEIQHRKEKHIFMVVLDLRGNPGGVLSEASSLLGLFLDGGVALQVRYGKAFYWRFLEYGTPHIRATPFLRPAYEMHKQTALERFKKRYAKYVDDVVKRKAIQEGNE